MTPYIRTFSATDMFIVPLLNIGRENLIKAGFVSAFMKDELREIEYERAVYLLFKPFKIEDFNLFVEDQRESNMPIIDEFDHNGYVVLVYKLPKKFEGDYEKILQGKFSETSKEYQKSFPMYYKIGEDDHMLLQHMIFSKNEKLKEYWKKELDLTITNSDQHWHFYEEREVLNEESLKRISKI